MDTTTVDKDQEVMDLTKYIIHEDDLHIIRLDEIHDELPTRVYAVGGVRFGQVRFKVVEDFKMPENLYGDIEQRADFFINRFNSLNKMGLLLEGVKGTGKTLLAKLIAKRSGYPVLLINESWDSENLSIIFREINKTGKRWIVIMDEFEKHFSHSAQARFLSIMDGTVENQCFFIVCANERLNTYLYNRPGRLRYRLQYNYLTAQQIREALDQNLPDTPKEDIDRICIKLVPYSINYDILTCIMDDIKSGVPVDVFLPILNIKPESDYYIFHIQNLVGDKDEFKVRNYCNPFDNPVFAFDVEDGIKCAWDLREDAVKVDGKVIITTPTQVIEVERELPTTALALE